VYLSLDFLNVCIKQLLSMKGVICEDKKDES